MLEGSSNLSPRLAYLSPSRRLNNMIEKSKQIDPTEAIADEIAAATTHCEEGGECEKNGGEGQKGDQIECTAKERCTAVD